MTIEQAPVSISVAGSRGFCTAIGDYDVGECVCGFAWRNSSSDRVASVGDFYIRCDLCFLGFFGEVPLLLIADIKNCAERLHVLYIPLQVWELRERYRAVLLTTKRSWMDCFRFFFFSLSFYWGGPFLHVLRPHFSSFVSFLVALPSGCFSDLWLCSSSSSGK